MLIMHALDFLYLCPLIKCDANWAHNSLKVLMELGVNLLNQTLSRPFSVVGKDLHMISSTTLYRCIRVLKDSKWSRGSFGGRGNEVTDVVNGELVRWTKSSKSLNTRPLRAFIMKSISSFIIYISTTMWGGVVFVADGRLMSCHSSLLEALLPSNPSWSFLLALVPSWSSSWVLSPAFFWCNYSSRSWFCLVRHFKVATRVWTCLLWLVVRGSSIWTLLVVNIKQVSTMTMQLFVWEAIVWLTSQFPTDSTN